MDNHVLFGRALQYHSQYFKENIQLADYLDYIVLHFSIRLHQCKRLSKLIQQYSYDQTSHNLFKMASQLQLEQRQLHCKLKKIQLQIGSIQVSQNPLITIFLEKLSKLYKEFSSHFSSKLEGASESQFKEIDEIINHYNLIIDAEFEQQISAVQQYQKLSYRCTLKQNILKQKIQQIPISFYNFIKKDPKSISPLKHKPLQTPPKKELAISTLLYQLDLLANSQYSCYQYDRSHLKQFTIQCKKRSELFEKLLENSMNRNQQVKGTIECWSEKNRENRENRESKGKDSAETRTKLPRLVYKEQNFDFQAPLTSYRAKKHCKALSQISCDNQSSKMNYQILFTTSSRPKKISGIHLKTDGNIKGKRTIL